ncbi:NADPH-dependent FMN reductase [Ferviditalea candida]|uniref:NAD(P)H-dependent oxidoreductase n=1 Tax=Ferviditalea candida TaxID=3108399 RepID=A0ABU5ZIA1_9BACL|nr:NAD(P)H-dependent oxidoreductase [Paenibacillaceae bacterium T2]
MQREKSALHIVGLCGSLRKFSFNRGLLLAFEEKLPEDVKFTLADISEIPFFNEDREQPYPEPVVKLKELLDSADALVVSTPEYNLSYTAVLKNAIEWISRRSLGARLAGKPVALMGAAIVGVGVSQSHLRDVMFALNMNVLNRPIVQVVNAREKFDSEGRLTDAATQELLGKVKDELLAVLRYP